MLDFLGQYIDPKRVSDDKCILSLNTSQSNAIEWEIVIGYALSKVAKIEDLGTKRKGNPDYLWYPTGVPVVVEVTSISDFTYHDKYPVRKFSEELTRIAIKNNIHKLGSLEYDLRSINQNSDVVIGVPSKRDMIAFFNDKEFKLFIETIKKNPSRSHFYSFEANGVKSTVNFISNNRGYLSGRYSAFTYPKLHNKNTIYNALKGKEEQIKKSQLSHPAILFICDNDCDLIKPHKNSTNRLNMGDVVTTFLNGQPEHKLGDLIFKEYIPAQGSKIHAVVWISIEEVRSIHSSPQLEHKLITDIAYADYASDFIKSDAFRSQLHLAFSEVPTPQKASINANVKLKHNGFYGGFELTKNTVKLSSLTLHKLLAGEISYLDFANDHKELVNMIRNFNAQGKAISDVSLEICSDKDDDWIKFSFQGTNPEFLFNDNCIKTAK